VVAYPISRGPQHDQVTGRLVHCENWNTQQLYDTIRLGLEGRLVGFQVPPDGIRNQWPVQGPDTEEGFDAGASGCSREAENERDNGHGWVTDNRAHRTDGLTWYPASQEGRPYGTPGAGWQLPNPNQLSMAYRTAALDYMLNFRMEEEIDCKFAGGGIQYEAVLTVMREISDDDGAIGTVGTAARETMAHYIPMVEELLAGAFFIRAAPPPPVVPRGCAGDQPGVTEHMVPGWPGRKGRH
jgi:hypothetical protein